MGRNILIAIALSLYGNGGNTIKRGDGSMGLFLGLAAPPAHQPVVQIELTLDNLQPLPPNQPATIVLLYLRPLPWRRLDPHGSRFWRCSVTAAGAGGYASLFTSLELGLVADTSAATVNAIGQTYRAPPGVARPGSQPVSFDLYHRTLFSVQGVLVSRMDYAWTHLLGSSISMGVELLIAGLFAEFVMLAIPARWGIRGQLIPSPSERSLQARLLYNMAPLALGLILALIIAIWVSNEARQMQKPNVECGNISRVSYF
jgi:hypothetical protein